MDAGCLLCYLNKYVTLARSLGDEATATAFSRELVELFLKMDPSKSSPAMMPGTVALLEKYYHIDPDRYRAEKEESNRFVLARLDTIRARVNSAPDPLLAGLQCAILGNYMDFSALGDQVSFGALDEMLDKALEMELDGEVLESFRRELAQGRRLLYLTDNAGEIGFDRIFAEVIHAQYPHLEITVCVRGRITQNDATREDAAIVGMPFPVIDNGNDIAGTELELLSPEAKAAMDAADVILAKGMGNTETLRGCGYPIYYAFLVKCDRFARVFQKPLMTPLFLREA